MPLLFWSCLPDLTISVNHERSVATCLWPLQGRAARVLLSLFFELIACDDEGFGTDVLCHLEQSRHERSDRTVLGARPTPDASMFETSRLSLG
jgi:hypothetical protein